MTLHKFRVPLIALFGIGAVFLVWTETRKPEMRERITPGKDDPVNEAFHRERYEWAKQFCRGKHVADIAAGEGYGSEMLRTVAASVDEYDYAKYKRTILINLEREKWSKHYDVIVSFETIEHLANPEFALTNMRDTADLVLISTPVNEAPGLNPFHKQHWTPAQLEALLERFFSCEYYEQLRPWENGHGIVPNRNPKIQFIAKCQPLLLRP